jgi:hypothetical protein
MFKSGDKVICIVPTMGIYYGQLEGGKLYTVKHELGVSSVVIEEVNNWYDKARFRLATELEIALN